LKAFEEGAGGRHHFFGKNEELPKSQLVKIKKKIKILSVVIWAVVMFQQRLPKLRLNKIKNIKKSGADVLEKTKICQNLQHVLTRFTKTCSRCT
jgi:hypothetical protein